jgi:pimeloyl-ACP methyl ester carboxylesterase
MPIEQLNGIELYYESHGEGPVVTFLHGAGGNHISWWQQIPVFSQRYRCITIDHRGFNRSTDPNQEGGSRFVDDLEALFERLGVERSALVSQSMGGRTALGFTVRHPERVPALALCDNWGGMNWPEMQEKATRLREARSETPPAPGGMGKRYRSEHPRGTFLYRQIGALNPPRAETATAAAPDAPTPDQLRALQVPTLFLVGSDDPLAPPEIIREVCAIHPNAQYVEVAGSGHSVYFEDAAAFNEHVGAFLDRHVRNEQ